MSQNTFQSYQGIRELLKQGDIVAFHPGKALGDKLYGLGLRLGGMGPHTHIAIVHREQFVGIERVWAVEEEPSVGCHVRPLSHYDGRKFDVYDCPVNPEVTIDMAMKMMDPLRKYSWVQIWKLVAIGVGRAFMRVTLGRIVNRTYNADTYEKDALVCSTYITFVLKEVGWSERQPGVWPSAIAKQLGKARLHYRPK
jgi:hypothetical protein